MNECADCAPKLRGVYYYTEQSVSVVYDCACGPTHFIFEHQGEYECPCGEEQTVNEFIPLNGRMWAGKPVLSFTCEACGKDFEDDRFTAR